MEEPYGSPEPRAIPEEREKNHMKNFVEHVKEDWTNNPLAVVDTACYVLLGLAAVKYLRRK